MTNSVCYIAIGGAVYVYVGDTGRKGKGRAGRKKKHPHRVLLSDIGFATDYNAMVTCTNRIPSYGLHLTIL